MYSKLIFNRNKNLYFEMLLLVIFAYLQVIQPCQAQQSESKDYVKLKGVVLDSKFKKPLEYASISVNNTNISTVSNSDGEFILKVPTKVMNESVTVVYLGFRNKILPLSEFSKVKTKIYLKQSIVELPEISVISKDPNLLIRRLMKNIRYNYLDNSVIMTTFYRESIKKRKTYASLSEAVVEVYKQPYGTQKIDYAKLIRARKSTNYKKIDTLVIKLQGGPYNNLNIDIIKNQKLFFNGDIFSNYQFTFEKAININDRGTYVVEFQPQNHISELLYSGKLYIDSETYALSKVVFSLNLDNVVKAKEYFVKKKPATADVIPLIANYMVDYRYNNGKWYYGYSRIELTFKINWVKRIFNSIYNIDIEMAITDWKPNTQNDKLQNKERLKTKIILNDEASGFSNPEFWGEFNVIEPDKSIENAIRKIKRQLHK